MPRLSMTQVLLCGAMVVTLSMGIRHGFGLWLQPITMDRGWTREAFAFAIAVQNLVWGFAQPLAGMIADRYGATKVVVAGGLAYAAGLAAMSYATSPIAFTLSAGVVIGVALACTTFGAIYGALGKMVDAPARSWALGLAGAVAGLGQFVLVPIAQHLIDGIGWGLALVALATIVVAVTPGAASIKENLGYDAAAPSQSMRAAIGEAFGHRGFWLLNAGFLACGFQLAFIGSHLPAYLLDHGLRAADAVAALAIVSVANVIGTYYCGVLGGLLRRKHLLAYLYLARSLAMTLFVLAPVTPWSVYVFSAVMGLLWLGTVPLTNGLVAQVFGIRYISTLFGFVFIGHQIGSFLGVWLGGVVYDATRSYDLIWAGAIALGVIAAALHWPIDDEEVDRPRAPHPRAG
jgi:MFS family permease